MDGRPLINRLLSGIVIFKLKGEYVHVKPAKVEDKAFADVYGQEVYEDALLEGVLRNKDIDQLLVEKGWWSQEEDEKLETLNKNLEQMKVDYYNSFFKETTRDYIKKSIVRQNKNIGNLFDKKYIFFDKTCEYLRDFARNTILLEKYAFLQDGSLATNKLGVLQLTSAFIRHFLGEEELKEIAKSTEWRILWNSSKDSGLFKPKGYELTNEQISVISWSRFYDGVYESMDRPNEKIIEDNIALDGWAIIQDRKRKEEEKKQQGEKLAGNVQDAGEVFIPVSNQKEQDQVLALNDTYGKSVIRSKAKQFEKGGTFSESDLNHVKKELQMESLRQAKESRR